MVSFVGKWKGKDFLDTNDFSQEEVKKVLDAANVLMKMFRSRKKHPFLPGKTLFMMFYNRSLRTRNSFEAGIYQLGTDRSEREIHLRPVSTSLVDTPTF